MMDPTNMYTQSLSLLQLSRHFSTCHFRFKRVRGHSGPICSQWHWLKKWQLWLRDRITLVFARLRRGIGSGAHCDQGLSCGAAPRHLVDPNRVDPFRHLKVLAKAVLAKLHRPPLPRRMWQTFAEERACWRD